MRVPYRLVRALWLLPAIVCVCGASAAQSPVPALSDSTVAATVNGEPITVGKWVDRMRALTANDFAAAHAGPTLTAGWLALERLITEGVVMQYAAKTGLTATPQEVDAAFQAAKAAQAQATGPQPTDDALRASIRYQRTLYNFVTINQSVTPEEVRAFYDQNFGPKWQLAVIRTTTRPPADLAYADLKKGLDFAAVATKYSEDAATRGAGGEVRGPDGKAQWISAHSGGLPAGIVQAVSALKAPGDYTPVLAGTSADGKSAFLIVRLLARFVPTATDFERARPDVERAALFAKVVRSGAAEQKVNDARKAATVVVKLPGYEKLGSP